MEGSDGAILTAAEVVHYACVDWIKINTWPVSMLTVASLLSLLICIFLLIAINTSE